MVNDSEISYADLEVRKLEEALAVKRHEGTPEEVAALELQLKQKKQNAQDLRSRKRRDEDRIQREEEQKKRDQRRQRLS